MSKIDDLIQEYCPDGVEYKELREVADFIRGKGLCKDDIGLGNVPVILYGELYTTYGNYINKVVSSTSMDKINVLSEIKKNDILFPISSTTKEAKIGKASVYCLSDVCYLGSDAVILRTDLNSDYLMYLLNSEIFEKQKMICVKGTTIRHLDVNKFMKIKVPIPPIEVQNEVVNILDKFTELQAELQARVKQYEWYRNDLLSFKDKNATKTAIKLLFWLQNRRIEDFEKSLVVLEKFVEDCKANIEYKKLDSICDIVNGFTPLRTNHNFWNSNDIPWFTVEDIRTQGRIIRKTNQYISNSALSTDSKRLLPKNTVLVCCTASVGECAYTEIELTTNQQFNGLIVKDKKNVNPKYIYYFTTTLKSKLMNKSSPTSLKFLSTKQLGGFDVPLPPFRNSRFYC